MLGTRTPTVFFNPYHTGKPEFHRHRTRTTHNSQNRRGFGAKSGFWVLTDFSQESAGQRVPMVAKAHFAESGPPGARQPWWREHRSGIEMDSFRDRISGWAEPRKPSGVVSFPAAHVHDPHVFYEPPVTL